MGSNKKKLTRVKKLPTVAVAFKLAKHMVDDARDTAARRGVTMSQVLREWIEAYYLGENEG